MKESLRILKLDCLQSSWPGHGPNPYLSLDFIYCQKAIYTKSSDDTSDSGHFPRISFNKETNLCDSCRLQAIGQPEVNIFRLKEVIKHQHERGHKTAETFNLF